ncbi:MAG: hypothetical protein ACLFUS_16980 [Candidatus Sumerlaeia bacterium]
MKQADNIEKQIRSGSEAGQKEYAFDEGHDPNLPADLWFQDSDVGRLLFIVFYTQACRWSRCLGCNLPSLMSTRHIPYASMYISAVLEKVAWSSTEPLLRTMALRAFNQSQDHGILEKIARK